MDLLEKMPINQTRWDSAHSSILSSYRTNPIPYRGTGGFVYDVGTLGLANDPRKSRFERTSKADITTLREFYDNSIRPQAKLLSIVGDSSKIDLNELGKIGPVLRIESEQLFKR